MMPSSLSVNSNRVKSITSRFEGLSEQNKPGDRNNAAKLQNLTTVPLNLKKVNVTPKENVLQRSSLCKVNSAPDSSKFCSNNVVNSNANLKDKFGPSCNFGNRKRLKEDNDFKDGSVRKNDSKISNVEKEIKMLPKSTNIPRVCDEDIEEDVGKENVHQITLSRQFSDPTKKLHRSPAFRCDRSEKLRDSRKNSFNSDCSDHSPQPSETDRSKLSKDKLKILGLLLEEKMKQDDFEFSKPNKKGINNYKSEDSHNIASETGDVRVADSGGVRMLEDDGVMDNMTNEALNDDVKIPRHILDQYAQVIKPKIKNVFIKNVTPHITEAVLSDSGVSSESENLISDDLDESRDLPKLKSFNSIRNNFEDKSFNNQKREELPNRRKLLKRCVDDDYNKCFDEKANSSSERLIDKDSPRISAESVDNLINDVEGAVESSPVAAPRKELGENSLSDTLKKVLKQPLPAGPPPKKPPRTFAALPTEQASTSKSPDLRINFENTKRKLRELKGKLPKQHRTKEESKIMLAKIENALIKHESGGKIMSPRPSKKFYDADLSVKESGSDLIKKTLKIDESPKNWNESKPKDVHYMCTEILDLHFPDKDNFMNSSNASLNSSESFQASNSFTKCLNSLNCTSGSLRNSSGVNYSKFGSFPNSNRNSMTSMCCSCNFKSPKDSKSCRNSMEDFSSPSVRLSTFLPSPDRSVESIGGSQVLCKVCQNTPEKQNQFKCHINNSASSESNPIEFVVGDSKSTFFVDRTVFNQNLDTKSQYGVLKKCKSQEHIYAEPFEFSRLRNSPFSPQSKPILPDLDKKPVLLRTSTQLEDGFGRIREADFTKIITNAPLQQNKDIFGNTKRLSSSNSYFDAAGGPDVTSSEYTTNSLESFKRVNDLNGKDLKSDNNSKSGSKVKDILMRLEGSRSSLRMEKRRSPESRIGSSIRRVHCEKSSSPIRDTGRNFDASDQKTNDAAINKRLDYLTSKIYDTPYASSPLAPGAPSAPAAVSSNASFLYGQQPPLERPPLYEKSRRPHTHHLKRRSPTEVDRENLSQLMTEIYDTVAEACILDGNTSGETDTGDEVSLKLTRSLTEKRKRYVRRVSSRTGYLTSASIRVRRDRDSSDGEDESGQRDEAGGGYKTYAAFPLRQNSEDDGTDEGGASRCQDTGQTDRQISKGGLFDSCMLVGMNFSTGQAYIKSVFPEKTVLPPRMESLVFPESTSEPDPKSRPLRTTTDEAGDVQNYALVLTNERGARSYGYCRRVLPEGASLCLPLAYCVISKFRAPAFYYKVLQEIESRHGSSDIVMTSILTQLYGSQFPRPGHSITLKQLRSPERIVLQDSTFKKNGAFRNSVNLGDVMKSSEVPKLGNIPTSSGSSENLTQFTKCSDKFRRKSTDVSELNVKDNELSVMKSLEKLYGTDLKEFQNILNSNLSPTNIFEREFGGSVSNLGSSIDDDSKDVSNSSEKDCIILNGREGTVDKEESGRGAGGGGNSLECVYIKRPLEPRLDEDNLSVLFDSVSVGVLVKVFGTLLIERKVVIICDKLSKLSSCIEGLQSILYPFTWQHTLISSIPSELRRDILEAPIPILAGLSAPGLSDQELDSHNFQEGMVIDISKSCRDSPCERVLEAHGDEGTLLPPLLAKTLKASLQLGPPIASNGSPSDEHARKSRNVLVAEAFLRFFVELLGDYRTFFKEDSSSREMVFEKEQFIKSARSKHVQYFLEWFTETAMFSNFIQQRSALMSTNLPAISAKSDPASSSPVLDLPYPDFYEVFDERVMRRGTAKASGNGNSKDYVTKGNYKMIVNKKVKVWRDKLRDLVN